MTTLPFFKHTFTPLSAKKRSLMYVLPIAHTTHFWGGQQQQRKEEEGECKNSSDSSAPPGVTVNTEFK